jgi:hypothetical protein
VLAYTKDRKQQLSVVHIWQMATMGNLGAACMAVASMRPRAASENQFTIQRSR